MDRKKGGHVGKSHEYAARMRDTGAEMEGLVERMAEGEGRRGKRKQDTRYTVSLFSRSSMLMPTRPDGRTETAKPHEMQDRVYPPEYELHKPGYAIL